MTRTQLLRAASSLALVAAMGTAAFAQTGGSAPGGGSQGPGQQEKQMSPGGDRPGGGERMNRGSPQTERPDREPGASGTTEVPKGKGGAAQRPTTEPKASDRAPEKGTPKSAREPSGKDDDRGPRAAGDRGKDDRAPRSAGDRDKDGRTPRTAGDRDKDDRKQSRDARPDDRRSVGERDGKDGTRKGKAAEGRRGDGAGERVRISEQQRTTVRERLSRSAERNRVTNVNFDIRVGASVPRNATLHVLPPDVVEIVPEYRGYRYVYVSDQIVIIDPNDYVVVAVLGGDGRTAGRRFSIAADDRVFIRSHVDRGAVFRLGIGGISIGMSLPETVELRPLPSVIVERVPDLRDHRYFIYEDDVVIVDPRSREVVEVLAD